MKRRLLLLFFCLILIALSCTREVSVQVGGPVVEEGQITGKIILPVNTKADTNGLVVLSATGTSVPVASQFAIDTSGKVSTTVLNNGKGDVLLLGYNYPGQTDHSISSESTALALLMNTLTLRSLSLAGKLEMIEKIKSDAAYRALVGQVTLSLQSGRSVTDTTNTELMEAMGSLFQSTTGLRTTATAGYSDPIKITTANTEVMLQNNNVAHTYVAGVYKKNQAVGAPYVIGGRTLFATSLADAAAGVFGDGYGIPEPVHISLSGNGEYTVRIRSGKPFGADESLESRMARNRNVHGFLLGILRDIFPIAGDCGSAVLESVPVMLTSIMEKKESVLASANSPQVFAALALDITGEVLESASDLLDDCDADEGSFRFLRSMGKTFSLVSLATKFMTGANITAHTNDLFQAKASIDSCFQVVGLKLVKCGEQPVYLTEIQSGNNQKGESGKALPLPLVVKVKTADGKPAIKASVSWEVKSGGGTVSVAETETSYDGIAQVTWTPGKGEQEVEAYVNKEKGSTTAIFKAATFDGNDRKVEIVSGNGQNGQYGKELSNPLTVRVLNGEGKPAPDVEVSWNILLGGGSFTNRRFITDAQGLASATWVLGPSGAQNVEVIVKKKDGTPATGSPMVFKASPKSKHDVQISIVSGNFQISEPTTPLQHPFIVKVTDSQGEAVSDVALEWEVKKGGGSFQSSENVTDKDGEARAHFVLDATPFEKYQAQTVEVKIAGSTAAPVTFSTPVSNGMKMTYHSGAFGWDWNVNSPFIPNPLRIIIWPKTGRYFLHDKVTLRCEITEGAANSGTNTFTTDQYGVVLVPWVRTTGGSMKIQVYYSEVGPTRDAGSWRLPFP